jgi:hypothetical protein
MAGPRLSEPPKTEALPWCPAARCERAQGRVGLAGADQEERHDDHGDGADVPPHRRVVELGHDPDAGDVQDQLDDQQRGHRQQLAVHQASPKIIEPLP